MLYYVAADPSYADILREEAERVIDSDGRTTAAMGKLRKFDSIIEEAQRADDLSAGVLLQLFQSS